MNSVQPLELCRLFWEMEVGQFLSQEGYQSSTTGSCPLCAAYFKIQNECIVLVCDVCACECDVCDVCVMGVRVCDVCHVCARAGEHGPRHLWRLLDTGLWRQFFPSSSTWDPGMELRSSGSKCLHLLRHFLTYSVTSLG